MFYKGLAMVFRLVSGCRFHKYFKDLAITLKVTWEEWLMY